MNRALPAVLHISLLFAAASAGMSSLLLTHNSDTVLQALVSLVSWHPYYWGENRFGMLVPLLALPVTNAAGNLIFQTCLIAWSVVLGIWLLHSLTEDGPSAAVATALSVVGMLLLFRPKAGFLMMLQSTYVTPLTLLLAGWVFYLRSNWRLDRRILALAIFLVLSFWINVANVIFIGLATALWPNLKVRERVIALITVAGTNLAATGIASLFPSQSYRDFLPAEQWAGALLRLLSNAAVYVVKPRPLMALLAIGLVILALRRRWDARIAMGFAACVQIAVVSTSEWVTRNGSDSRYIVTPLFVLGVLATGTLAWPAAHALRGLSANVRTGFAAVMVIVTAVWAFGFPSPARAASYLEQATRPAAQQFAADGCTHLIGDYWQVWMAVYHDMVVERTPPRHAVSFRSDAIRPVWDGMPQGHRMYCSSCSDGMVEYFRVQQGVPPLERVGQMGPVCRWTANSLPR